MAGRDDLPFEPDLGADDIDDELDVHYRALRSIALDYIEEHAVPEDVVSALLVDVAIELRKVGYVLETEKPSVTGLKLELDRWRADFDGVVRSHKKEAESFLEEMRDAMADADSLERAVAERGEDDDTDADDEEALAAEREAEAAGQAVSRGGSGTDTVAEPEPAAPRNGIRSHPGSKTEH